MTTQSAAAARGAAAAVTGAKDAPAYNPAYTADHIVADQRTYYVRRETWQPCAQGVSPAACAHRPRCQFESNGGDFGRWRLGWTRVRGSRQAERERYAWEAAGWSASIHRATGEILAEVREWEGARS